MGNRLHIEFGGTNLRYEVLDDQFQIVKSGHTSLVASGITSLADFIDTNLSGYKIEKLLVAAPSLTPDGTIPNSGELHFQATLPENHRLAAHCQIYNDFTALAANAANIAQIKPVGFDGNFVLPDTKRPTQFYFIGPGTGLGTASALFDPGTGTLINNASEIQHTYMPVYTKFKGVFQPLAFLLDHPDLSPEGILDQWREQTLSPKDVFSDLTCPVLTYEEVCCGNGLQRIYDALIVFHGCGLSAEYRQPEAIVEYWKRNQINADIVVNIWAECLGMAANALIKGHFPRSADADIVIVLGGGVIPRMLAPEDGQWQQHLRTAGHPQKFIESFQTGLKLPKDRNPSLNAVFDDITSRAKIVLPTHSAPGLMGLHQMAMQQARQVGYVSGWTQNVGP